MFVIGRRPGPGDPSCGGDDEFQHGYVILNYWLSNLFFGLNYFVDSVFFTHAGSYNGEYFYDSAGLFMNILENSLGSGSSSPPALDYFSGQDPATFFVQMFNDALQQLRDYPNSYERDEQLKTDITGYFSIPFYNNGIRSTFHTILRLGNSKQLFAENLFDVGQSGFFGFNPSDPANPIVGPHCFDMVERFECFN